ncbi:hypothetical protein CYME_CML343C [Cyanidioschyzon merolae strain 10D]|jgi:hypothetical protein|uniref:Uncharacterized protein n=1 Tax=Cyanidioschyzon merolae (strain NIES-3377 / 10D) TaxID=280699 RepID=M1V5I2_CYAM1|nr:hypothetical protein CYME_CML343C [Cyanidioschyzon merolae strain 10D]BAM80715.1 hypothetical protein CYME_CML343C [Cyanidioschyzon merolae strain 10D]|eukprot:XP_005536751.1 hypothetical protein CYME_CML343C [Cyanidioschyzon merolae strain 10D]
MAGSVTDDRSRVLEENGLWETFETLRRARLPSSCLGHVADLTEVLALPFRPHCRAGSLLEVALQLEAHAGVPLAAFDPQLLQSIRLSELLPEGSLSGADKPSTGSDTTELASLAVWQPAWLEERQQPEYAPLLKTRRRRLRQLERHTQA